MATRTIELLLEMNPDNASLNNTAKGVKKVEKSLKDVEAQANRTRERMEKIAQVGNRLALVGSAITAPFILAMKKYVDTAGETEGTSKRIVELGKRWEESQVRIGRVTAEIVLPALEKALDVVDKVAAFAEKNPGAIKAAVGIGGTLVVLGGLLSTAASIVSTIATVQGVAASFGIGTAATTAAATTGTAALTAGGIGTAVTTGITAFLSSPAFLALLVLAAAEGTRQIFNAVTGQNQTWADIGKTLGQLLILSAEGWDIILGFFGADTNLSGLLANAFNTSDINLKTGFQAYLRDTGRGIVDGIRKAIADLGNAIRGYFSEMINSFISGLSSLGNSISSAISGLISGLPGFADGGMITSNSIFRGGERGREFVLNNQTTRAAESIIGGTLTQQRLLEALAGGSKKISYYDNRRIDSNLSANDRRYITNDVISALNGAL